MPRPDQETQLTATLTPRNASAKDTSSPAASVSPVIKPAAPVPAPSGPLRPIRNKTAALPTLSPREQSAASTGASTASFVKSFDEIMKDKEQQEKGIKVEPSKQPSTAKPREEPQQRKADTKQARTRPPLPEMSVPRTAKGGNQSASATATGGSSKQERAKGNGIRSRPSSSGTSTTASSSSSSSSTTPSFGVKTLEELLQEKNNSKPASASAAGAPSRPGGAGGVKRGREESAATTRALPQPQQKQPRADPAAKPAQLQPVEEEDDFEKELAEIGVDDINSVAAEVIDDDELNELLED